MLIIMQKHNVSNQREHLVLLLANVHIRQFPKPDQQPKVCPQSISQSQWIHFCFFICCHYWDPNISSGTHTFFYLSSDNCITIQQPHALKETIKVFAFDFSNGTAILGLMRMK